MARVEVRYAAALLAAVETTQQQEVGAVLAEYAQCMATNGEMRSFLLSPIVPAAAKKEMLRKLHSELPQLLSNFLCLLVDKGRINLLAEISDEYEKQLAVLQNTLVIHVSSAFPLSQQEQDDICARYKAQYGAADAVLKTEVNPQLLGGIRVQIGDSLYDGSLFGKLEGLRREISKSN